jgi:hypothetical protein
VKNLHPHNFTPPYLLYLDNTTGHLISYDIPNKALNNQKHIQLISKMASSLATQPPSSDSFILSYPAPHIFLVTINRPQAMNSIPSYAHWEAESIFTWFDNEPSLRVAIITGAGSKAFCAGQDLIEQAKFRSEPAPPPGGNLRHPKSGFAGISRRVGKKPIIAAVNGFALGGGFEICLNWYAYTARDLGLLLMHLTDNFIVIWLSLHLLQVSASQRLQWGCTPLLEVSPASCAM